jgi:hypothetical protein
MEKTRSITGVFFLFILLQNLTLFGQRISVSGTEFRKNGNHIWLNGTNTPWNKWNDFGGGSGNYLTNVNVDFYNIHYYDWQNQWFGNPFDLSPTNYNMNSKPCIIGESSAKGAAGYTAQQCYQKAFEKGWQGLMVWTSNGVDGNGDKWDSKPGADWIYDNYPNMVAGIKNTIINYMNPDFRLFQNSPNPFNATTTIGFTLPQESNVEISIYNISGNLVKTLVNSDFSAGDHSIVWNCSDNMGNTFSAGLYFYKITAGDFIETKKMLIIK